METFWASVFVFGLLIFFHEAGHFLVAKLVGIKVHEFSLGFGPKLVSIPRGETSYSLRFFPLGGFVRMAGMDPEDKDVPPGRGFRDKTVPQRAAVIFAGPFMNFLLASLLLAVIFAFEGIPVPTTEIVQVLPDRPAAEAGMKAGDRVVAIEGRKVTKWDEVTDVVNRSPGKPLQVVVERGGETLVFTVVPEPDQSGQGKIGVLFGQEIRPAGFFTALWGGVEYTLKWIVLIVKFIGKMIFGQVPADLGGPVRVVWEINRAVQSGFFILLQLAAFLSINLGLFNLFPIPALDGSHLLFLGLEAVRGRPIDPVKENYIHLVGFGLLLLLIVFITYNDILQLYVERGFEGQGAP